MGSIICSIPGVVLTAWQGAIIIVFWSTDSGSFENSLVICRQTLSPLGDNHISIAKPGSGYIFWPGVDTLVVGPILGVHPPLCHSTLGKIGQGGMLLFFYALGSGFTFHFFGNRLGTSHLFFRGLQKGEDG